MNGAARTNGARLAGGSQRDPQGRIGARGCTASGPGPTVLPAESLLLERYRLLREYSPDAANALDDLLVEMLVANGLSKAGAR